jgi:bilin biosynthesis protein
MNNVEGGISPEQVDALLESVGTQIALDTFDSDDTHCLQQLVESLGDTRGLTRLRVAETLGEIGRPATPVLLDALTHHANVVVRRAAAKTLTLIADPTAVPVLIQAALNDEDTVVRGSSVGALARIGETAVPPLLDILASAGSSETLKGHAAWALAFIGAEAKEYLYPAIQSDSPEVRAAVVGAIAKVAQDDPKPDLFELLIRSLLDTNIDVRCEAAAALGNLSYQPSIPTLLELLSDLNWESRKAAALALMKMGDPTVLAPLKTQLTKETEEHVQTILKLAIAQVDRQSKSDSDWS